MIVERWHTRFKFERLETMLKASNSPAPFSIRINTIKTPLEQAHEFQQDLLRKEKTHSERRPLRVCLRTKEFPKIEDDSLFQQGYFTIQDEAAQLIGYLVAPKEGETIIDTCCGPGGKVGHIYELANGKAKVIGIDKGKDRIEKTRQTLKRLGHDDIELIKADFIHWDSKLEADRILVDAPCSGLGVLRRHPEGKWQKNHEIIGQMVGFQRELMTAAWGRLKKGGELIYSVCSFETEETLDQIKWALGKFGEECELVSPVSRLPDFYKKYVTRENALLIYCGNQDDMDGFGAFILRKV